MVTVPMAGAASTMRAFQAERAELRRQGRPEAEMNALFTEVQSSVNALFADAPERAAIGAFEGAMYESQGLYRPATDCIMFTRDEVGFCKVCSRAIERVIDLYAK